LFLNADSGVDTCIVKGLIHRLKQVQQLAEKQRRYRLKDTSLVLIYDAAAHGMSMLSKVEHFDLENMLEMTEVRMIEFGNVTEGDDGGSKEYLAGIKNLISTLDDFTRK